MRILQHAISNNYYLHISIIAQYLHYPIDVLMQLRLNNITTPPSQSVYRYLSLKRPLQHLMESLQLSLGIALSLHYVVF